MVDVFENDHTVMLLIDPDDGRIVDANPAAEHFYGWSRAQLRRMRINDINTLSDDDVRVRMADARERAVGYFAFQHRTASGDLRDVEVSSGPLATPDGTVLFSVVQDVSEKHRALRGETEAAQRWRLALEAIGGLVWEWVPGSDEMYIADSLKDLIGVGRDFPASITAWQARIPAEDRAALKASVERLMNGASEVHTAVYRIAHADGGYIWLQTTGRALHDANGEIERVIGLDIDITAKKQKEQELRELAESRATLQRIIDRSPAIAFVWRPEQGWPMPVVSMGVTQWGYTPADLTSGRMTFLDLVHPDDRERVEREVVGHTEAGSEQFTQEYRIVTRYGLTRDVVDFTSVERNDAGDVVRYQGVLLDVTERKTAQRDLERANAALAAMADAIRRMDAADAAGPYDAVCHALTETGGYPLVWIAQPGQTPDAPVSVTARAGADAPMLDEITVRAGDVPEGRGPTGLALRTGKTQMLGDMDPAIYPDAWAQAFRRHDIHAAMSLPVRNQDQDVIAALTVYSSTRHAFTDREREVLEALVSDLEAALRHQEAETARERAEARSRENLERLRDAMVATVTALARTIEQRDPYTAGHQHRVAVISTRIAARLGYDADRLEGLRLGAELHDIGKIMVPAEILNKPGRLMEPEFAIIKAHAQVGYEIISDIAFAWPLDRIVHEHHERLDGTGYPQGLSGDRIAHEAKIVAVADVYEAMTSHRPYRPALPRDRALEELRAGRGVRYEPEIVDAWLSILAEEGDPTTLD